MQNLISLNRAHVSSNQLKYIADAIELGKLSSIGKYSNACEEFFDQHFKGSKCLLTHSCTDALELIAILIGIKEGDEVVVPSFTFVSTANAFLLRGAKIVWCDSQSHHPNVSIEQIKDVVSERTKAIVIVHYAGVAVDMDPILKFCKDRQIIVIEDAAQAMCSNYKNRKVGTLGQFSTFSFHDTKPISCGEGGLLVINDLTYVDQAMIILEKGTDRHAFLLNQVNLYQWLSIGSSFAASQLQAACLFAQLEEMEFIFAKRKLLWNHYMKLFSENGIKSEFNLPVIDQHSEYNSSIFYLEIENEIIRNDLLKYLNEYDIQACFHYQALHESPFGKKFTNKELKHASYWQRNILRLPIHTWMDSYQVEYVVSRVYNFFNTK
ncbi:MAG: dTDP-4-amino-4,6-dideoxygalactose transaminase [Saprospiraceae bacterium]